MQLGVRVVKLIYAPPPQSLLTKVSMRFLRWTVAVMLLAAVAFNVVYRAADPERRRMDDHARAGVAGYFVRLTDGVTHYETAGPDTGGAVVLAAGFSVPAYIWDSLFFRLADSGVRVIRYDYFGRGWSDRPEAIYDQEFFVRQLRELLDSLHLAKPIDLAGLSFGGAVITSFAVAHPERVHSLMYFDPSINTRRPLRPEERSRFRWNVHMIFRGGSNGMAKGQLTDFLHPERYPDWVSRYRVQQQFKGTREAWRRTRAAIAVAPDQYAQLRRLNAGSVPILLVWGREDRTVPFSVSARLRAAIPRATFVPVDSAGHLPHLEQPDTVIGAVMRFLRRGRLR